MAGEITIEAALRFTKGGSGDRFALPVPLLANMAGTKGLRNRQSVGTTEEPLAVGDVGIGGWLLLINRDVTNYVSVKSGAGQTPFAKMLPGESCGPFRLHPSATSPHLQADTAACEVEYLLIQA